MLIGLADDLEEQFGPRLGEGNISQFINQQQMESLEMLVQALKPFFFPALHQLGDQVGGRIEGNVSVLGTSGKRQGTDQLGFAGPRVSEEEAVLFFVQVLPPAEASGLRARPIFCQSSSPELVLEILSRVQVVNRVPQCRDHIFGPMALKHLRHYPLQRKADQFLDLALFKSISVCFRLKCML
jgi:hypothetical protein